MVAREAERSASTGGAVGVAAVMWLLRRVGGGGGGFCPETLCRRVSVASA